MIQNGSHTCRIVDWRGVVNLEYWIPLHQQSLAFNGGGVRKEPLVHGSYWSGWSYVKRPGSIVRNRLDDLKYLNEVFGSGAHVTYPTRPSPTQSFRCRQSGSSRPFVVVHSHWNGWVEVRTQR